MRNAEFTLFEPEIAPRPDEVPVGGPAGDRVLRAAEQPYAILGIDTHIGALTKLPERRLMAQPIPVYLVLKLAFAYRRHLVAAIRIYSSK